MTPTSTPAGGPTTGESERTDLAWILARQRRFLRYTVRDLDDEQARQRATVSELTLGGLVKHVAATERAWIAFAGGDPAGLSEPVPGDRADGFRMLAGETLSALLDDYADTARRTEEFLLAADLDTTHPLPEAPWFESGERWSVRRVLLHIAAETAQHAGHADILRETLDGARTMG